MSKAAFAGAAGGIAGSLAMNVVSWLWRPSGRLNQHGTRPDVDAAKKEPASQEPATAKVADQIAEPVLERKLTPKERDLGGRLVHYAYGAMVGALYGVLAERKPWARSNHGIPFGLLVWAGGIPSAIPALKLSGPPQAYSPGEHAFGLVGHLAYGFVLDLTQRKLLRNL